MTCSHRFLVEGVFKNMRTMQERIKNAAHQPLYAVVNILAVRPTKRMSFAHKTKFVYSKQLAKNVILHNDSFLRLSQYPICYPALLF